MSRLLFVCAVVVVTLIIAAPGFAQTPKVSVYFDQNHTQVAMDCPGPVLDTLYVVAENFDTFLGGIEFKISYPPQIIFLADIGTPPVTIGSTPNGISMGYALPENAFTPLEVLRVIFLWNCVDVDCPEVFDLSQLIRVVAHPFGGLRGVEFLSDVFIDADGGNASVGCLPAAKMDIKPTSCPNPFNAKLFDLVEEGAQPKKGGVLPVAILGTGDFDVTLIDLASIRLEGVAPVAQGSGPQLEDVATPVDDNSDCQCSDDGPDGIVDVKMKFSAQEIAAAIGPGGGLRELTITFTYAGIPHEATDCIKVVGKEANNPIPQEQTLAVSIFPNPFNPTARVKFVLPESQSVRLAVYTVTGALVEVIHQGVKEAGEHVMEWDASGMPSGVYFIRLEGTTTSVVKRVTLLK